ncbi:MAG TPA: hypothetical protein VFB78_11860 [Acidimicrobiales bacterium]|nr:hypothetical protein [Acidimicrobiales bacterium]
MNDDEPTPTISEAQAEHTNSPEGPLGRAFEGFYIALDDLGELLREALPAVAAERRRWEDVRALAPELKIAASWFLPQSINQNCTALNFFRGHCSETSAASPALLTSSPRSRPAPERGAGSLRVEVVTNVVDYATQQTARMLMQG